MTAIEDARDAAENCWPMDMDGLPGNQSRKERELLRRGFELGYRAAVERLTTPPTAAEREALVDHALRIASKGVQINDGHTYSVHAHDLVDYAETIRTLAMEEIALASSQIDAALEAARDAS